MASDNVLELAKSNKDGRLAPCAACAVRDLSICGALEPEQLSRLNSIVSEITVAPTQALFFECDTAEHLFIIRRGCARVYKMLTDGRRMITGFLFPSDFVGLASNEGYAYTAEAVTELNLCRFPRRSLEKLFMEFPALERQLLQAATNELASAQDQMVLLGRKTAQEKLASFLHLLSRRAHRRGEDGNLVELPMNRTDIGDFLGLTIESVSRCFTQLRKLGVIQLENTHTVRLMDAERLTVLSGSDAELEPHSAIL
jgi:CRP/FNR family transcriptional regulator